MKLKSHTCKAFHIKEKITNLEFNYELKELWGFYKLSVNPGSWKIPNEARKLNFMFQYTAGRTPLEVSLASRSDPQIWTHSWLFGIKNNRLYTKKVREWLWIPPLSITSHVTLVKLLNPSEPQTLSLESRY